MRIPDKFAQTYKELVSSLRREARDNLKMASLKKPIAITLGEKYRLMAEIESNIADSIVAMWRRERKNAKLLRNCDVGSAEEQAQRFYNFCTEHSSAIQGMCDYKCPCIDSGDKCHCLCKWMQMPYKEGGAK